MDIHRKVKQMSSTHMRKKRKMDIDIHMRRRNTDIPTRRMNTDIPTRRRNTDIPTRRMNTKRRQLRQCLPSCNALEDFSEQRNNQKPKHLILLKHLTVLNQLIVLNHLNHPKHLNNLMIPKILNHILMVPLHLLNQSKWRMTRVTTTTLNQIKRRHARTDTNISVDSYRTELNLASKDLSHTPFASANIFLSKFDAIRQKRIN